MSYRLIVEASAAKDLRGLSPEMVKRVWQKIRSLEADPRPDGCKKLKSRTSNSYSVRVGDIRVLYTIDDKEQSYCVYKVEWRGAAYSP
jgi:mRNA interferase RelE/StbE